MDLAALGAFFSGAGAVISAVVALRISRKRCEEECLKRIEALREGFEMGKR